MPALGDSILIIQPDGSSIYVYLQGDEFAHIMTTVDGYALLEDKEGFLRYATLDKEGVLSIQNSPIAHDIEKRTVNEVNFTNNMDKVDFDVFYQKAKSRQQSLPNTRVSDTKIGNFPTHGQVRALVILAQYIDKQFTLSTEFHESLLNERGFFLEGHIGSVKDYFIDQSYEAFEPIFDVVGPVQLSNEIAYYGTNTMWGSDSNAAGMIEEACVLAYNSFGVNFAKYDNDNDGVVDMVYVIYAGYGENAGASVNTIWPHKWQLSLAGINLELNGKKIDAYACSQELSGNRGATTNGIGTFCHEFSHVLGLPDLYNTVNSYNYTLGDYDLMAQGGHNNDGAVPCAYSAFERYSLGWMGLQEIDEPNENMVLPHIIDSNIAYKLTTENEDEYFVLENRQQNGWDQYIPGSGMMITHIDYKAHHWRQNTVNDDSEHHHVRLVCADGFGNRLDAEDDLFPNSVGNNCFTDISSPSSKNWDGKTTDKWVTDIKNENGLVTFNFMANFIEIPQRPTINTISQSSAIASWQEVPNAESYLLILNKLNEKNIVLSENFSKMTGGSLSIIGRLDISNRLNLYTQAPGWSGQNLYEAAGYCCMARHELSNATHITTPSLDLTDYNGVFTVYVKLISLYDSQTISATAGNDVLKKVINTSTEYVVFLFENGTSSTNIQLSIVDGTRIFLDEIIVVSGDDTSQYSNRWIVTYPKETRSATTTEQWNNYYRDKIKEESVTQPTYLIDGLEEGLIYSYTVKAIASGKESKPSDEVIINLSSTNIQQIETQDWLRVDGSVVTIISAIGECIEIFNMDGTKLSHNIATSIQTHFTINEPGIYIIRRSNDIAKVSIQ